jgi:hypothetical protein
LDIVPSGTDFSAMQKGESGPAPEDLGEHEKIRRIRILDGS